ncbi:MAG: hypothetical protein GXO89_12290 [Chlorobi bacterium]|nr:hypothetical protein [Chlorobiota bacterium]
MYLITSEYSWTSKKLKNLHYAISLGVGTGLSDNDNTLTGSNNYSLFFGKKHHFVEFGVGYLLAEGFHLHYGLGYRLYIANSLIVRVLYNPGILYSDFLENDSYKSIISRKINFSVGYQLTQNDTKKISDGIRFFIHRSFIETEVFLLPFEKDEGSPVPPIMFNYGFVPYRNGNFDFIVNGGLGVLSGGDFFYQAGISTLYGKDRHFLEAGVNLIFALLQNYNFEYKYSNYVLVQPQIGYRYNFKFPLYLRLAYSPYIRTLDWKREGGLQQNVVLGVGYRFGK